MDSFYFYDLETTGRNPRWHRIVQCAGVRTDAKLEPLGDPEAWTVAVGDDVVPEPEAVAITGLSPQRVATGLEERAFFREFLGRLAAPGPAPWATTACASTMNSSALGPGAIFLIPMLGSGRGGTPAGI